MTIGLLQLNSTIGDFAANRQKLLTDYEKVCAGGAEFVFAPELFLCGYPPRDLLLRADFVDANLAVLAETARSIGQIPLCVGYVDQIPDRPYAFNSDHTSNDTPAFPIPVPANRFSENLKQHGVPVGRNSTSFEFIVPMDLLQIIPDFE